MSKNKLKRIKKKRNKIDWTQISKVDERGLKEIASVLYEKFRRERKEKTYAQVKEILTLLLKAGYLLSCFAAPGMMRMAPDVLKDKQPDWEEWKKFNKGYLKRSLKRLEKQKLIVFLNMACIFYPSTTYKVQFLLLLLLGRFLADLA